MNSWHRMCWILLVLSCWCTASIWREGESGFYCQKGGRILVVSQVSYKTEALLLFLFLSLYHEVALSVCWRFCFFCVSADPISTQLIIFYYHLDYSQSSASHLRSAARMCLAVVQSKNIWKRSACSVQSRGMWTNSTSVLHILHANSHCRTWKLCSFLLDIFLNYISFQC